MPNLHPWKIRFALLAACSLAVPLTAHATPSLVVDVASGEVLSQEQATQTWYPASITKLMTVYVALKAVEAKRLTLDTPLTVSARATHQAPSRMGFRPGTEVTLDNALKMLMVKSANDIAVTIAEGIGGSVDGFADEMNRQSANLGMLESRWFNPNGLPDKRQVTSARDMALLARALLREFPAQKELFGIGALQLGSRTIQTHNGLLGRYPGADGMKTGFTCAAGFNVVATASRGGRSLITVVLGAPSARDRTAKAANLFDKGFNAWGGGSPLGSLSASGTGEPPDMRGSACTRHGRGGWASEYEDFDIPIASGNSNHDRGSVWEIYQPPGRSAGGGQAVAARSRPQFTPVEVYIGRAPGWSGPVAVAASKPPKPALHEATVPVEDPAGVAATATAFAPNGKLPKSDAAIDAPMALSGALAAGTLADAPAPKVKPGKRGKVAALAKVAPAKGSPVKAPKAKPAKIKLLPEAQ